MLQTPEDRVALIRAVVENSGKFFFGKVPEAFGARVEGPKMAYGRNRQ
jgi:hypothetical protein